jgi:hypothetical protein
MNGQKIALKKFSKWKGKKAMNAKTPKESNTKNMTIRFPLPLWKRLKMLEIDGKIKSIHAITLEAVEKEAARLEKKKPAGGGA